MPTLALTPASTSVRSARSRWRGGAVDGSVRRQTSSSSVGTEKVTETSARRAASCRTSRSRTIIGPRVMIENGFEAVGEHLEAAARQPVAALGGLVRVGGRADGDRLALPRRPRELAAEHLDDVRLDADRAAVAVVRGAVGSRLEGADVAERAAVDAAHVRVQRPVEGHPLDAVERERHGSSRYSTRTPCHDRTHVFDGVVRVTLPLPTGPGHVHAYLLRGADGWTLVDTGLGLPGHGRHVAPRRPSWTRRSCASSSRTSTRITSAGGAGRRGHRRAGAPGAWTPSRPELVWGTPSGPSGSRPGSAARRAADVADELDRGQGLASTRRSSATAADPSSCTRDDEVDGWRVVATPGHADGHLCLVRDGVLVAGDHLLDISPAVGLYPHGDPDPLGDYLESLSARRVLAPRIVYPGHGEPIRDAPDGRGARRAPPRAARRGAEARSRPEPRTGYDASFDLFGRTPLDGRAPLRRGRDALPPRAAAARRGAARVELRWRRLPLVPLEIGRVAATLRRTLDDELPPSSRAREGRA